VAATDLLQRSVADARVAGVCGGIAERYRIDPLLVRVLAVIIALSSGVGFVLYGAAWLLLPRGTAQPALVRAFPTVDRVGSRTWIVLVAGATVVVLVVVGSAFNISLMPTMIVLGILYASQLRPGSKSVVQSAPSTPAYGRVGGPPAQPHWPLLTPQSGDLVVTTPAGPWRPTNRWGQPLSAQDCATFFSVPDPVGLYDHRAPAPPQRRSRVLAVISGLAIATFFAMLSLLGAFVAVPPVTYLAVGLVLVGAALIAGAFVGRPRGFIAVATVLVLVAGAVTTSSGAQFSADPPVYDAYDTSESIPPQITVDTDYTMDLATLSATSDVVTIVRVRSGDATIVVPDSLSCEVTWTAPFGTVTLPDGTSADSRGTYLTPGYDPSRPTLRITIDVEFGDLVVTP